MANQDLTGFSKVDEAPDPITFVQYLDVVSSIQGVTAYKNSSFGLLYLHAGSTVLDVGCGLGQDATALAGLVGATGRVVALDNSDTMIAEARSRAGNRVLPVEYQVGDILALPLADNVFDACRADRVFTHLSDPGRALAEMIRVTRVGGRIVVANADHETVIVNSLDRKLTRTILNFQCDNLRNGWMGRRLFSMFHDEALRDIVVVPVTVTLAEYDAAAQFLGLEVAALNAAKAGVVSSEEANEWLEHLKRNEQTGHLFGAITVFIAAGTK